MTRREQPPGQLREQSCEPCAGPERCPEERTVSRGMTFETQASYNTEDRRQSGEEAIILPFPVQGRHGTCPSAEAGGAHPGFAIIIPSLPATWTQVCSECVTLLILRDAFGTRKLDAFMRSAAIFLRRL